MRIGYSTWGMREVPIEQALPAIAALGYQGVELSVAPGWTTELYKLDAATRARIRELLAEHSLVLTSVIRNASMVADDADENEANMQSLRDAIDLTAELAQPGEVSVMTTHLGGRAVDWEARRDIAVERLLDLADYAAERGVIIAVEIHCGSMLNLPERVVWLFEQVDHPSVRLNFTPVHDGEWHEYEVEFAARGALRQVRIDPSTAKGVIEIDWVRLCLEDGSVLKAWEFEGRGAN